MRYTLIALTLMTFISSFVQAEVLNPNNLLKNKQKKELIYNFLKTNHSDDFAIRRAKNKISYTITELEIDDSTRATLAMTVKAYEAQLLGVECSVKLHKLANLKWRAYASTCKRVSTESQVGIFYKQDGKLINQLEDGMSFVWDDLEYCYQGKINDAVHFSYAHSDDLFWVGDEHEISDISADGELLVIAIFDNWTFSDSDASEEEREEFTTYEALAACK